MTMAVTEAVARGQQAVLCASTGNTSASAAAYAARAGITCAVLIPQGKIAMGKLAQAVMHGAKIIQIDGNFDDCLELARKLTADFPTVVAGQLGQPVPHRGPEDRGVRDRRRARRRRPTCTRCRSATRATSPRTGRATPSTTATGWPTGCRGCSAPRPPAPRRWCSGEPVKRARDHRHRDPDRLARVVDVGGRGPAAVRRPLPGRHRRGDPRRLPPGRPQPRACSSSPRRRPASPAC